MARGVDGEHRIVRLAGAGPDELDLVGKVFFQTHNQRQPRVWRCRCDIELHPSPRVTANSWPDHSRHSAR